VKVQLADLMIIAVATLNREGCRRDCGANILQGMRFVSTDHVVRSDDRKSELQSRRSALFSCHPTSVLVTGADIDRAKSTCDIDLFSDLGCAKRRVRDKKIIFLQEMTPGRWNDRALTRAARPLYLAAIETSGIN
jgi:hypothetical protein